MNRGLARRPIFETSADVRYFLSRLAWASKRGQVEVHAYSILTTHFHLLVRSPEGRLPLAMQSIQDLYARWFNRRRRRDGPLFRGRYRSRIIDSETYWNAVLRYIDRNPVDARISSASEIYPHGSAYHYGRETGPPWLTRDSVEKLVRGASGDERFRPEAYARFSTNRLSESVVGLVERRLSSGTGGSDPLDDLVGSAPQSVRAWMVRKARLADGTKPGLPVVGPQTLRAVLTRSARAAPDWTVAIGGRAMDGWSRLESGLLRLLCGLTYAEIADLAGTSLSTASVRVGQHRWAMLESDEYAARATDVARAALGTEFGR